MQPTTYHDIIVIGASAGGPAALSRLLSELPAELPASLFLVNHLAPETAAQVLLERIGKNSQLPCLLARHEEPFERGHAYLAPPDHHLLIRDGRVLVTKGPKENRSRPAIDPLFRSAAAAYGSRVIGVVLTGLLDDGTAGLSAVRRSGGIAVVQDPREAAYADMPQSALRHAGADHCVPIAEMGSLLVNLAALPAPTTTVPADVVREAQIAERLLSGIEGMVELGTTRLPYSCPDCGGALWEIKYDPVDRFRCQVGHAHTAASFLSYQTARLEETMWVALRLLEERRHMLLRLAERESGQGLGQMAEGRTREAEETAIHIERIRETLAAGPGQPSPGPGNRTTA